MSLTNTIERVAATPRSFTPPVAPDRRRFRVALFSGNYNYVRDGANQALNRLVEYLLRQGVAVRVYSPTTSTPAFTPSGDLVSLPSVPIPGGRSEYRFATHLPQRIRDDLRAFAPDVVHISSPDRVGHAAADFARALGVPVVASMHTRFETYLKYYGIGCLEGVATGVLRRFYLRCDAVVAPSASIAALMREQGMGVDVGIWTRGIDRTIFSPSRRDAAWRARIAGDDRMLVGFVGRLVMEKGLETVAATLDALTASGARFRPVVVGDGPARDWLERRLPDAHFCGHLDGAELGMAVASLDVLLNPSTTESFGNVTLEAMACGVPVVGARAPGSDCLIREGETGRLIVPGDIAGYARALIAYGESAALRALHGDAGARAARSYDWDLVNEAMIDTYLRAIEHSAAPQRGFDRLRQMAGGERPAALLTS